MLLYDNLLSSYIYVYIYIYIYIYMCVQYMYQEDLKLTENAQPAVLAHSIAALTVYMRIAKVLRKLCYQPSD